MIWLVMVAVGVTSYAMRAVPLFVAGRIQPSPRTERALARAGTAALTSLLVSGVMHAGAGGDLVATLLAVAAGGVAAARRMTMLPVVLIGCGTYVAATALLGPLG